MLDISDRLGLPADVVALVFRETLRTLGQPWKPTRSFSLPRRRSQNLGVRLVPAASSMTNSDWVTQVNDPRLVWLRREI